MTKLMPIGIQNRIGRLTNRKAFELHRSGLEVTVFAIFNNRELHSSLCLEKRNMIMLLHFISCLALMHSRWNLASQQCGPHRIPVILQTTFLQYQPYHFNFSIVTEGQINNLDNCLASRKREVNIWSNDGACIYASLGQCVLITWGT